MRSKLHLLYWLFAIVPLAFFSCSDDDDPVIEDTTLETSTSSVNFTKDGGSQTISITTNAAKWVASSPLESDWLSLSQSASELNVTAEPNTTGAERKGYILINAGNTAAKINVLQSEGDVVLSLSTETLSFEKAGGEQRVDVISNEAFTVEADAAAEWLQVAYVDGADYFTLTAAANESNDVREAKIYVSAGSTTRELAITQTGEDIVILPLLAEAGHNQLIDIMHFEEARGSAAMQLPDGLFNSAYYFITDNADFPQMGYVADISGDYQQAMTATTNLELADEIAAAIEAKGFTLNGSTYTSPTIPYSITVQESAGEGITISAVYTPVQPESFPTFATLPLTDPQMGWTFFANLDIHGASVTEVQEWEAANGGVYNTDMSNYDDHSGDMLWFDVNENAQTDGVRARSVWVNATWGNNAVPEDYPYLNEVTSARAIYTDLSKMLWIPDGSAYFYFTTEFTNLLAESGFVYLMFQEYEFYGRDNEDGSMDVLCFYPVAFTDWLEGQTVIDFQTFKETSTISTVSLLSNKDKLIEFAKAMNDRMTQVKKALPFTPVKRIK